MGEFRIEIKEQAKKDLNAQFKIGDKASVNKIEKIFEELKKHPYTGTGRPEQLKGDLKGCFSRRINYKDRLIYSIDNFEITVYIISAIGHYSDK